ncbi:uncharacterized protein [Cicer arietinum]|uniref:Two-component response regulator-like APRR5 isoform X2 n=1 Tax=Cicer arietinum TaxID=3827 RepID=A0A1S3E8H9_CICAR|nr:two-component response regulator-like APRR5 isoform X2 [Cicer arietinum]
MSSDLYSFGTTFQTQYSTSQNEELPFFSDSFPFFSNNSNAEVTSQQNSNSFDEPLPNSLHPFSSSFFSFSPPLTENLTTSNENLSAFEVKNEKSQMGVVDYYNINNIQYLPHSYSGVENVSKYMQRSYSSNSFEGKKHNFVFQTHHDNVVDSPIIQTHDRNSPENNSFVGQIRRVCSTGDLQMKANDMCRREGEEANLKVGRYSAEERKERISKYKAKRTQRNFNKTIKYACRKTLADNRPRVRGRFARNDEYNEIPKPSCLTTDEEQVDFWMEELHLTEGALTDQYINTTYGPTHFQYFGF